MWRSIFLAVFEPTVAILLCARESVVGCVEVAKIRGASEQASRSPTHTVHCNRQLIRDRRRTSKTACLTTPYERCAKQAIIHSATKSYSMEGYRTPVYPDGTEKDFEAVTNFLVLDGNISLQKSIRLFILAATQRLCLGPSCLDRIIRRCSTAM